jgi:hypothetical protein
MTVKYNGMAFPPAAQVGERVDITVTIENNDPYGIFYRCGVSVKDQSGIPFVVWDDINYPELSYVYESPVLSFFLMPNQPCTFHGHYYQTAEVNYPAEVRLHWRDAGAPSGTPFNTEATIYQFTVNLQSRLFSLVLSIAAGSGSLLQSDPPYLDGSTATISAAPAAGYAFDHWEVTWGNNYHTEVLNGNPQSVLMSDNVSAKAYFRDISVPPTYYYLAVNAVGNGSWSGEKMSYNPGETASVTALPETGYEFQKWVVSGQTFTTPTASFVMNSNKTATAYFKVKGTTPPPADNTIGIGLYALVLLEIGRASCRERV